MKFLKIILAVLLLAGCSAKSEEEKNIESTPVTSEKNSSIEFFPNQVFEVDNLTFFEPTYSLIVDGQIANMSTNVNIHEINILENTNGYDSVKYELTKLLLNGEHEISFSIDGEIEVLIEVYDDANNLLYQEMRKINNESYSFLFDSISECYNGKLVLSFNSAQATTLKLENVKINSSTDQVMINQIGYETIEQKRALFLANAGNYFEVINSSTNEIMYIGNIVNERYSESASEYIASGDFSTLVTEGTYIIKTQNGNKSSTFEIKENIYLDLLRDAFKMLSSQTCGHELSEEYYGEFSHEVCHDHDVIVDYEGNTDTIIGGWHDAGDYGRYTNTTAKVIIDLMLSYIISPELYNDDMQVYGSNNNTSDILDEIKNGLDFFLDIQLSHGAVYNKVSSLNFPGIILPEEDEADIYAISPDSASTAFVSGILAIGSKLFSEIDAEYSELLKSAAQSSYEFSMNNSNIKSLNPDGYTSGNYPDLEEDTEKYFMHMAHYFAFEDEDYLNNALTIEANYENFKKGVDYTNPALYANYLYIISDKAGDNIELYDRLSNEIIEEAGHLLYVRNNDPFYISLVSNYIWGGNYYLANSSIIMLMAYTLNNNSAYKNAAFDNLDYFLGRNILNTSFVTGHGDVYPNNPHHRESIINEKAIVGALVGGPDSLRTDAILQATFEDSYPDAMTYLDHSDSWSSNEVAIYYNSSLILMLSLLNK